MPVSLPSYRRDRKVIETHGGLAEHSMMALSQMASDNPEVVQNAEMWVSYGTMDRRANKVSQITRFRESERTSAERHWNDEARISNRS